MLNYIDRLAPDSLAIFLFHGVIAANNYKIRNYTHKHILQSDFAALLKALKRTGQALNMEEVVHFVENNRPFPPRAFTITFDDGFENNFSIAAPILADYGIPATFYITSDFVENNGMSWIDRIEHCMELTSRCRLALPWSAKTINADTARDRIQVLEDIRATVKHDPTMDVSELVDAVFDQCGLDPVSASDDPLDRKLTWEQVRTLAATPGFIVGGHTHTHAIMSFLEEPELDWEIGENLRLLNKNTGARTRHFSYPEGLAHCYSESVIAALKRKGIVCSPTALDGVNKQGNDLFHLKRIAVI